MNHKIKIRKREILSDNWYVLNKVTFDYRKKTGEWETQSREAYDRGNGATILLYNKEQKTVILTRQFRVTTYLNGNASGMMIEACAGIIDEAEPEACIIRETEEETGYRISKPKKIYEAYMSPGSLMERVHFYIAEYSDAMKIHAGGGLDEEQEEIEVLELKFDKAWQMVEKGDIIDGKTIMLLQYLKMSGLLNG